MEGFTGDSIITEFKGLKFPLQWRMDIGWVGGKNGARMALKKISYVFTLNFLLTLIQFSVNDALHLQVSSVTFSSDLRQW